MKAILIYSGKGGVGKTTTTVNLAKVLSVKHKVVIIDADVNTPSVPVIFPDPKPNENLTCLSLGYKNLPIYVEGSIIRKFIKDCISEVNTIKPDYVLIDTPPSITDVHINLIDKIDISGMVIVTQPNDLSVSDVNRTAMFFENRNVNTIGVIENMVQGESDRQYVWPILGSIPFADEFSYEAAFKQSKKEYEKITKVFKNLDEVILKNKHRVLFDESITPKDLNLDFGTSETPLLEKHRHRFVNVKTWNFIREHIADHQRVAFPVDQALFEATEERLSRLIKAFEEDDTPYFMITNAPNVADDQGSITLFPGEIGKGTLIITEPYGLPAVNYITARTPVTLHCWECMPATEREIMENERAGGVRVGERRLPGFEILQAIDNAFGSRVGLLKGWEESYKELTEK